MLYGDTTDQNIHPGKVYRELRTITVIKICMGFRIVKELHIINYILHTGAYNPYTVQT